MTHVCFERTLGADNREPYQAICNRAFEHGGVTVAELPDRDRASLLSSAHRKGHVVDLTHPVIVQLWFQGRGTMAANGRLVPDSVGVGVDEVWTFRYRVEIAERIAA